MQQVQHEIRRVSQSFRDTIQRATTQAKLDIYDFDRDEIIFGVLSRQYRLYNIIATNPGIWTADLGSMFHRVMVDTLITLKWIIQQNKPELYRKFKEFSLGKQKLLKLHVEELVDQGRDDLAPYEEYLAATVNDEIWEEFLSVDLGGNFAGLDTRKMAQEVGLRDTYNLVYSPGSSELHGEWTSLKRFNLVRCGNPLHRFHRLPRLSTPSILAPYAVLFAANTLIDTFKVYLESYQLQQFSNDADNFLAQLEEVFANL